MLIKDDVEKRKKIKRVWDFESLLGSGKRQSLEHEKLVNYVSIMLSEKIKSHQFIYLSMTMFLHSPPSQSQELASKCCRSHWWPQGWDRVASW